MSEHRSDAPVPVPATAVGAEGPKHSGPYGEQAPQAHDARREEDRFGGMRFFLAFFGWLTATGAIVLLSAVVTGVLALVGVQDSVAQRPGGDQQTAGAVIAIVVLAGVLFVGYSVGGYVAGRMARFSGLKQGLAVWIWGVIVAIVAAVAGAIAGNASGAFSQLSGPGLQLDQATATGTGIAALVVAVVMSLLGALLGGLGGMRFHRKVDRFNQQG